MENRFTGRAALVTGAASGMGCLTAKMLTEEGAQVVMLDINEDILREKAAEIGADWRVADVRRYEDIEAAVQYAKKKYGSVDITISYAGGAASRVCRDGHAFNDMPIEAIDWGIDVNFRAPLYMARAVFNIMAEQKRGAYDYIILDPPAFTKSSATVAKAIRGYKEINLKAMRILPRGGYLATCSCSHFMTDDRFRAMLADAAKDAQVSLRQIEARQQGPDHPILWNVPETDYLKFYLFQIV